MTNQNIATQTSANTVTYKTHPFVTGDVTAFENAAKELGIELSATQLSRGEPTLSIASMVFGDTILASYSSSQKLGLHFHTRPDSLNFSIQSGDAAARMDGKARSKHSLVFYSLPGAGQFTAVIPKRDATLQKSPAVHVSLPQRHAPVLGIPEAFVGKGWVEIPLDERIVGEFIGWAEQRLSVDVHNPAAVSDQLNLWLNRMLEPLRGKFTERDFNVPGHYSRIIGLADALIAGAPSQDPLSILTMANELRISTRTLQRAFQSVFGTSVSLYVQHRRLERARSLLLKSGRPICHSARHMGFEHASRFAQQYRRLYGNLPSDTRRVG
jgi:AraC-like DNA-binding protein